MREILFRAKDVKKSNEWRYGSLIHTNSVTFDGTYHFYKIVEGSAVITYHDVNGDTVGQYTGIDDKNGVKVFEADILKVRDCLPGGEMEFMGVVEFKDGSFVIENDEMTHYRWIDYEIEVIGNKFDNHELLEA